MQQTLILKKLKLFKEILQGVIPVSCIDWEALTCSGYICRSKHVFPSPSLQFRVVVFRGPCRWELAGGCQGSLCSVWIPCKWDVWLQRHGFCVAPNPLSEHRPPAQRRARRGSRDAPEFNQRFYQCAFIQWTQASRATMGCFVAYRWQTALFVWMRGQDCCSWAVAWCFLLGSHTWTELFV